ncbi:uncharacterized protein SPPG_03559 [Spizellomyces punctatus DAOM BR117]|uniref:TAFII55 protein conserved region domain-containing protein n=1 Tax=Spizellomyces punctatus (strain DAOM BR117) TaxID=645134 RepID=A0A0L0HL38_SPIPD|nr:uncharacterized protein SPPG_03559 [Spizellomyces punctatus DAOM BR117]KND01768.1 hypothetical protein SPPG_03559 [Spizellomyces punctatus DAOM BR117]|eukprot:XP_016609807.1 hypothetical protein SPPG_03559 [Spizellomyces punctatus DAOM BR117]
MVATKAPSTKQPKNAKGLVQTRIGPTRITIKPKKGPLEDEEEAPVEEHFILRMPSGEPAEKLREAVKAREIPEDFNVTFYDPRRATFRLGADSYRAKLVDLPCIIESHKTLDNKQFYKVADISQMLVVDGPAQTTPPQEPQQPLHHDEYTWPHGLTPPLWNVRKRRFRKRISKRTIEDVEREVVRLLEADAQAENVLFEVDDGTDRITAEGFDEGDEDAEGSPDEEGEEETAMDVTEGGDEEDDALTAAWEEALAEHAEGDEDDDEEEDEDEESEDEDEDEEESGGEGDAEGDEELDKAQLQQQVDQLSAEIRDLESKIEDNRAKLAVQINPIMRKRFEDIVKRFTTQLHSKRAELVDLQAGLI